MLFFNVALKFENYLGNSWTLFKDIMGMTKDTDSERNMWRKDRCVALNKLKGKV